MLSITTVAGILGKLTLSSTAKKIQKGLFLKVPFTIFAQEGQFSSSLVYISTSLFLFFLKKYSWVIISKSNSQLKGQFLKE